MTEHAAEQRKRYGQVLLLVGLLMFFFLCLAFIIQYDDDVVCRYVNGGELCSPTPARGWAILGAWSSISVVVCAGLWLAVPKSVWRSMVTSERADVGIDGDVPATSGNS